MLENKGEREKPWLVQQSQSESGSIRRPTALGIGTKEQRDFRYKINYRRKEQVAVTNAFLSSQARPVGTSQKLAAVGSELEMIDYSSIYHH